MEQVIELLNKRFDDVIREIQTIRESHNQHVADDKREFAVVEEKILELQKFRWTTMGYLSGAVFVIELVIKGVEKLMNQ